MINTQDLWIIGGFLAAVIAGAIILVIGVCWLISHLKWVN